MTSKYTVPLSSPQAELAIVGGKGASLARMANAGLPVPDGFHVTTAGYRRFVEENGLQPRILAALQDVDVRQPATLETASHAIQEAFRQGQVGPDIAGAIAQAYAQMSGLTPTVAVRSSATAEDLPDASFAGQQETFLNVQGATAVLDAVKRCWASLWTARAIGYRVQHGIDQEIVSLAVVVQALVPAEVAGILFTANPLNGRRDQAVINAAWGLGEAVVGGLVTPDTFTVDKTSHAILAREIADKETMTVRVDGGTDEQPVSEALRQAPSLRDAQAVELAQLGTEIENLYGMPMDIEWALADGTFAIVQARPITALPKPAPEPPTEWPLPDPKGHYMRASIIDLMPDPISPLFATMGFAAYDDGIVHSMTDITKSDAVLTSHLTTINSYAYSDARYTGPMLWWTLTRMLPSFPRMMRDGMSYWREHGRAPYIETTRRWENQTLSELSAAELLDGVREMARAAMFNLTAQMIWMGACAGSEMLFTRVYDRLVKHAAEPDVTAFLVGFDSVPIRAEKSLYDLAMWCREREALTAYVLSTSSKQIAAGLESDQVPTGVAMDDWQSFQERFRAHVAQFGHIIYDLDFAKPLPLDNPAPMVETIKLYLRGEGVNPYERQQSMESERVEATERVLGRIKGLKRWAFTTTLRWAQSRAQAREDGLADIGLGYPVLHRIARELGGRLVDAQTVERPEDVFWLRQEELEEAVVALERGEPSPSMATRIQERRAFARAAKRVTPPPVLPASKRRVLGISVDAMVAVDESSQAGDTIKGAGTSVGQVTAPACVLHGPEDFSQMQPGCVLVAKITTPAWTPLFAMAAAVVTDIGGPLSHGSIVAREYGIPAVMGTGVATRWIQTGQTITVDGSAGTVTLLDKVA
jgi:phosphohistidine swiveling domain-containing protein